MNVFEIVLLKWKNAEKHLFSCVKERTYFGIAYV